MERLDKYLAEKNKLHQLAIDRDKLNKLIGESEKALNYYEREFIHGDEVTGLGKSFVYSAGEKTYLVTGSDSSIRASVKISVEPIQLVSAKLTTDPA